MTQRIPSSKKLVYLKPEVRLHTRNYLSKASKVCFTKVGIVKPHCLLYIFFQAFGATDGAKRNCKNGRLFWFFLRHIFFISPGLLLKSDEKYKNTGVDLGKK